MSTSPAPASASDTQYAAPVQADVPTDADVNASLHITIVALLASAMAAIGNDDHAGVITYVGGAKDLLDALAVRS